MVKAGSVMTLRQSLPVRFRQPTQAHDNSPRQWRCAMIWPIRILSVLALFWALVALWAGRGR